MVTFFYIFIFLISCFFLVLSAKWLIDSLTRVAKYLGWKEFVVAFFTVSLGAAAPEFFIGVLSAVNDVPELAFGNILGQNILLFAFTVGICALILKNGIEIESKTVRDGSTFAVMAALMPLILILDGTLSRPDGIILLAFFFLFIYWLFSKKERFSKVYEGMDGKIKTSTPLFFFKNLALLIIGLIIVVLSAYGIVESSKYLSEMAGISIPLIGILVIAAGVGIPETYFAAMLARKGQSWMILGGLMGAVAISSTLVLGIVALIEPIIIDVADQPAFFLARIFLVLCAALFLFFVRSGKRISTKEGAILLSIYASFAIIQILLN